jgi:hypothetical protein
MKRLLRTASLCLCLLTISLPSVGCSVFNHGAPAQDAANQKAISNRQALIDARSLYASTERMIISLHRSGNISTERGTALVSELQRDVRPLLDVAQAAMVNGNFEEAILRFTAALAQVTAKAKATAMVVPDATAPPSPLPAVEPWQPGRVPPQRAAFPVAVILGTIALEALKAYQRKKAEEVAAGQGDQTRIDELDKQLAAALSDDDAADAEANAEFKLPSSGGQ